MESGIMKFGTFAELGEIAPTLDKCRREESWFKNPRTGQFESDGDRRDIVNLDEGHRSAVVSDIYQEYQHADVINQLAATMTKAKLEGHGKVYDNGDKMTIVLTFDNVKELQDPTSKKGISIGARFKNSYNKQNSVTGSGWFLRLACTNGMTVRKMIPEMSFSERHTRSILSELPNSINKFTTELLSRSVFIGKAITLAATIPVVFDTREQRLQTLVNLVEHQKVGELIEAQLTTLTPTKWDVYNAITQVATHERMGETVRDRIEKVSERVLDQNYYRKLAIKEAGKPNIEKISTKTTALVQKERTAFPDEGESLSNISNKLSELIQVQKEMLDLFRKLDRSEKNVAVDNH